MRKFTNLKLVVLLGIITLLVSAPSVWAISYHVSIDVSSLVGSDLELEIDLYDNSSIIGDSYALLDNVFFGQVAEDFETGDIGGFDDFLNPASVDAVLGNLNGAGSYVMRIDEDLSFTPTFTWRDFPGSADTTLEFDFAFYGDPGGADELVFSILDPVTLDPLLPSLTPGFGDVLAVTSTGMDYTSEVTVSPTAVIPEPVTMLGLCLGLGGLTNYLRKRQFV